MKLRVILALGLIVAGLVSCQCMRRQSAAAGPNSVKIDEHSVLIPGTAISEDDREAVSSIFKKYDSSLYRIAVYEKGKLRKHLGTLSEVQIAQVSEFTNNAKTGGLTNWTFQIGYVTHVNQAGNPTHITTAGNPTHVAGGGSPTHVTTAGRPTHVPSEDSDALVKEVTPVLEKYSR
jgi:hypothetical protein